VKKQRKGAKAQSVSLFASLRLCAFALRFSVPELSFHREAAA
jgi:hypothetical protein